MKLKNKLLFTCILALIVCVLLVPCAFAEGEAEAVSSEQRAVSSEGPVIEEPVVETVEEAEFEVPSSEFVVDEETEQVTGDGCQVTGEEFEVPSSEFVVDEETEAEKSEERIEKSEETAVPAVEGPKVYADFTAADGSVHSLELGESVNLGEFLASLGYEGEVSSFASSNSEALDVNEEGQLVFKSAFTDATVTVIVNGEEVVIPVHDPAKVNAGGTETSGLTIEQAFGYQTSNDNLVITLTGDCVTESTLIVGYSKTITLDLNGHTLSLMEGKSGSVIEVWRDGSFTLEDSVGTGKITGGNTSYGGGVFVSEGGTFEMNGGTITDNTANNGGGVYNDGTFTMNGGEISGNTAWYGGGGVYNGDTFTMTSGSITANIVTDGYGGGVYVDNSTFNMTGGTISGNTAFDEYGGGVFDFMGNMTIGGTATITGNVLNDGEDNFDNNLHIYDCVIEVADPTDGMNIGVTLEGGTGDFTSANGEAAKYFNSDNAAYVAVNNGTVVELVELAPNAVAVIVDSTDDTSRQFSKVQAAVDAATNGQTIKMVKDSNEIVTIEGGTQAAPKAVTLDLNGHVLDGNKTGRVITINAWADLTLKDSNPTAKHSSFFAGLPAGGVITGGKTTLSGGGVYVDGGSFTMTGGTITRNTVTGEGNDTGSGGGVCVNGGSFTMTSGKISYNTTGKGGGVAIKADGTFTMSGGTISNNTATNNGGGVSVYKTRFNMTGGTITGNTADYGGGVTIYETGTFTMTGGTITGNTASKKGGGVCDQGTMTVGGDAQITGNTLADGTTANNLYLFSGKTVTVQDGFNGPIGVTTETAPVAGSPVDITGENNTDFSGCFDSDNDEYSVVYQDKKVQLVVVDYVAINVDTGDKYTTVQGAVDEASSGDTIQMLANSTENVSVDKTITLDLNGHTLTGTGTGSVITVNGNFTLAGTGIITGGNAMVGGGVCVNANGSFTMKGGSITDNEAGNGGGVYVYQDASFTMEGGSISDNTATNGGGVFNNGMFIMHNGEITDNTAANYGGGVYTVGSKSIFFMNDGSITGNEASEYGGGVYVYNNASFTMNGGRITENEANNGGGVCVNQGTFTMNGGSITDNEASESGGGVYNYGSFTMKNNAIISENSANRGGGVFVDDGNSFFAMDGGGTIDQNEAQNGGGVYVAKNGRLEAVNGTISNCEATENGGGIYVENGGTATLNSPGSSVWQTGSSVTGCSAVNGGAIYSEGAIGLEVAKITDNTATGNGGGICLGTGGSIFLGSTAKVTDNTVASEANNLYISDDVLLVKIGSGEDVKEPQSGMSIGVTTETAPTISAAVDVTTTGNKKDYTEYFFSDNDSYMVANGDANKVLLCIPVEAPTAETGLVYNGKAQTGVSVTPGDEDCYTLSDNTATNAGNHTATATLADGCCWSDGTRADKAIDWSIAQKEVSVSGTTVADKTYDGTTDATVTPGTVSGAIEGDVVTVIATGKFDTAEVGTDKTVTVTYSTSNTNYKISPETETFTASILERPAPVAAIGSLNVYVDGKLLTEGTDYNWVNGKVVLTAEFVATLEAGEHVLTIEFPGNTVDEDFSIVDGIVVPAEDAKYLAV